MSNFAILITRRQFAITATATSRTVAQRVYVGKPDKISNIRPLAILKNKNDSPLETQLKELQMDTQQWHHKFWMNHNKMFSKSREEFDEKWFAKKQVSSSNQSETTKMLEPEDMAIFHRNFLHNNLEAQRTYDREWKTRNKKLLFLSAQVAFQRFYFKWFKSFFSRKS